MDELSTVYNCLQGLSSSKTTERKKNAVLLENLLKSNLVIDNLDRNTLAASGSPDITWNVVFKAVNRFIEVEVAALQSSKETQSSTTLSNREKKKQELSRLFKLVLTSANRRGSSKLNFSLLIERVEYVLKDAYTQQVFGAEYVNILLKYILRVRAYWLKISPARWRKLTKLLCNLYTATKMDRAVLANAIHEVMQGSCVQGQPNRGGMFAFFTDCFSQIRSVNDVSVMKSMLASLNIFCKTVSTSCRIQLCHFGETHMDNWIWMWSDHSAGILQEELIDFLHLLVKLHHPHGATNPDNGAYAHNWDLWQKQLILMHELIVTNMDKMSHKYKFLSSSTVMSPGYVAFAADVFKQIPKSKVFAPDFPASFCLESPSTEHASQIKRHLDVAGSSQTKRHLDVAGSSQTKRPRLSPESRSLMELICEHSNTLQAVPWLQVLHQLVSKYPQFFSETELATALQVMAAQLADNKLVQLFQHLFEVLSALVTAVQEHDNDDYRRQVNDSISVIWLHCISTINSRQAQVAGYQEQGLCCMASMISSALIAPTQEIWNLFLPELSSPSPGSDHLLTALLAQRPLPEGYTASILGHATSTRQRGAVYPLRQTLITWLLPDQTIETVNTLPTSVSAKRVAYLVYMLTLEDPSSVTTSGQAISASDPAMLESTTGPPLLESTTGPPLLESTTGPPLLESTTGPPLLESTTGPPLLESTLLKSTFNHQPRDRNSSIQRKSTSSPRRLCTQHIPTVLDFLIKHLHSLSATLQQQMATCETVSWLSCVLSRLLFHLWAVSSARADIQHILKRMLGMLCASMLPHIQLEEPACLASDLTSVADMLRWEQDISPEVFHVTEFIRSCLPATFVDRLIDVASGKRNDGRQSQAFSTRAVVSTGSSHDDDDDVDLTGTNRDAGAKQGIMDFLNKENLTETEHIQVICAQVLCGLTAYDTRQMAADRLMAYDTQQMTDSHVTAEIDIDHLKSTLLRLISSEILESNLALNLHLLLTVSKHILTSDHHVLVQDITDILVSFKLMAKQVLEDQAACCHILSHLRHVIPHLSHRRHSPSEELNFCRDVFLKFISDFWHLAVESTQHLRYELATTLLDLLKHDPDGRWGELQISCGEDKKLALRPVKHLFTRLLNDSSVIIRTFIAESIGCLFVEQDGHGRKILRDRNIQKQAFDAVFMVCGELLDIQQGHLSEDIWQDELVSCQVTFLQTMLAIIIVSPVYEKQCLLGVCQMVADKDIPICLVKKMMSVVQEKQMFDDMTSYMCSHLPYLIHNWISQKMVNSPLSKFPYQLLGHDNLDNFLRFHQDLIVAELLINQLDVADLRDCVHVDVGAAVLSALPRILSHILPPLADHHQNLPGASSQHAGLSRAFTRARKCYTVLESLLSEQTIKARVCEQLEDVVVAVVSCVSTDQTSFSMVYPEINPPSYSPDLICRTLDYLAQTFIGHKQGKTTLIASLTQKPDGIYQVLLSLSYWICREQQAYEQQHHLQTYGLFLRMLVTELEEEGLNGGWAAMIRDSINRLLVILIERVADVKLSLSPSYEEEVVLTILANLQELCSVVVRAYPKEMAKYFHRIVDTVACLVTLTDRIRRIATDFLTSLLSNPVCDDDDDDEDLAKARLLVNPLPELSQLASHMQGITADNRMGILKYQLDDLIQVCILMADTPSPGLAKRLDRLTSYILYNHSQVQALASTTQGLQVLNTVVCQLLKMAMSSMQEVAVAASKCLGAIGPIDLCSLSFPQQPMKTSRAMDFEMYKGHQYEKYCWLFHALDSCLLDKSLLVVETAGKILKKVLATKAGAQFEADYCRSVRHGSPLFMYLHPFKNMATSAHDVKTSVIDQSQMQAEASSFNSLVDRPELWLGCGSSLTHQEWIKHLTCTLLSTGAVHDELMSSIAPVCALKSQLCEEGLPYLIHDLLQTGDTQITNILSRNIAAFFHCHSASAQASHSISAQAAKHPACMNKLSVRTMLNVIQFLRTQNRHKAGYTAWSNNFWLDVDYLELARAAEFCAADFSTILFTEIWWEKHRNMKKGKTSSSSQDVHLSPESHVDAFAGDAGQTVQKLLLEAFRNIGDPDGIYGCGAGRCPHPVSRIQTCIHEQDYEKALSSLMTGFSQISSADFILQTLESCAADQILHWCLCEARNNGYESRHAVAALSFQSSTAVPTSSSTPEEFQYQAAWRLGQWDMQLTSQNNRQPLFQQSLYQALISIKQGHLDVARLALNNARYDVVKRFNPEVESSTSLYPFLSDLQCLTYLHQLLDVLPAANTSVEQEFWNMFADSSEPYLLTNHAASFSYQKPVLQLLASVANILASKAMPQAEALQVRAMWSLAVGARQSRQYQLSEKVLQELSTKVTSNHAVLTTEHLKLEQAKLFWARNELDIAKNILKDLIGQLSQVDDHDKRHLYSEALCTYGNWLAETRSEAPEKIISDYFEKCLSFNTDTVTTESSEKGLEGFVSLARFADEQYQRVAEHMRSPTFETKQNLLHGLQAELTECQEFLGKSKYLKIMERTLVVDQQEAYSLQESLDTYLLQAVRNYLRCLHVGEQHNLKVFRLIALWFDNCKNVQVNQLMQELIFSIQPHKFLPLHYQLAARMSFTAEEGDISFQHILTQVMESVASSHPHHALWVVLALAHAYKDDELSVTQQHGSTNQEYQASDERVDAARTLLEKLHRKNEKLSSIVTNMERLCVAYIQLANWTVTNKTNRNQQALPKNLQILNCVGMHDILLPTVDLMVDPTCLYTNVVSPAKFSKSFRVVGGINLPKIITVLGSDGRERVQLVKGQDDLRQDAVMQQVFALVNDLLAGHAETGRRHLNIRTYKVIPLSQKCGVLQWCEGTQPMGEYLIGGNGAHERYRPGDWSARNCREYLHAAGPRLDNRLKAYQEICANFRPVFHHFFMENFLQPSIWFERRLTYTRSVATNSIVGYILGLGDRHLMNILIDLSTAEIIHIDLGIAFEQGQILPTPEVVPFRLTRDIVDGMGLTGVEGVFRRCCEKTMEVMKNNCESLLTIVQVLLFDPLSHWCLTPQHALAIQRRRERANQDEQDMSDHMTRTGQTVSASSGQVAGQSSSADNIYKSKIVDIKESQNKMAERTLLRLKQKLVGQEDGSSLSLSGHVNLIIQKASNPDNLCRLYAGWQPYL